MSSIKNTLSLSSEREWTTREQLILASAVLRSGDQNWVSVSRAIKPLLEAESGSADYFSHKNCAQQYSSMLDKAGTHKRRRSVEGTNEVETANQQIVRELVDQHLVELDQALAQSRDEYIALKREMDQIEKGELDAQLPAMWEEIQAELALSKSSSSSKKKSSPSKASLSKQLDSSKQRKRGSPSSTQSVTGLTRSLSMGVSTTGNKKPLPSVIKDDTAVSEGGVEDSLGQVAALLSYAGGSPAGSVSSDTSEHPLAMVMGQSPRPLAQNTGERSIVSSSGLGAVGGVAFPAGGVVLPLSGVGQDHVRGEPAISTSLFPAAMGDASTGERKIKMESGNSSVPKLTLPLSATKSPHMTFPKLPLEVKHIKREPSSASPTSIDSSSPRLLATPPFKEEKVCMPMQTPPSTHVPQMPAEVHVIIQQPNTAALPVQENPGEAASTPRSSVGPSPFVGVPISPLDVASTSASSVSSSEVVYRDKPGASHSEPAVSSAPAGMVTGSAAMDGSSLAGARPLVAGESRVTTGPFGTSGLILNIHSAGVGPRTSPVAGSGTTSMISPSTSPLVSSGTSPVINQSPSPVVGPSTSSFVSLGTSSVVSLGTSSVVGGPSSVIYPSAGPLTSLFSGPVVCPSTSSVTGPVLLPHPSVPVTEAGTGTIPDKATYLETKPAVPSVVTIDSLLASHVSPSLLSSGSARTSGHLWVSASSSSPVLGQGPVSASSALGLLASSAHGGPTGTSVGVSAPICSTASAPVINIGAASSVATVIAGLSAGTPTKIVVHPSVSTSSSGGMTVVPGPVPTPAVCSSSAVHSFKGVPVIAALTSASPPQTSAGAGRSVSAGGLTLTRSSPATMVISPREVKTTAPLKTRPLVISKEKKTSEASVTAVLTFVSPSKPRAGSPSVSTTTNIPNSGKVSAIMVNAPTAGSVLAVGTSSASQQGTKRPIPSSTLPILQSKSSPTIPMTSPTYLLGSVQTSTAKSSIFPPHSSPAGGEMKVVSSPAATLSPQPIRRPQKTAAGHIERKAVAAKTLSLQSEHSLSSKGMVTAALNLALVTVASTRTFSVANTCAVVAHCVPSVTATKTRLSPAAINISPSSSSPGAGSLTSQWHTTAAASSPTLSIPVLSPSQDLVATVKLAIPCTAITSSSSVPVIAPAPLTPSTTGLVFPVSRLPTSKSEVIRSETAKLEAMLAKVTSSRAVSADLAEEKLGSGGVETEKEEVTSKPAASSTPLEHSIEENTGPTVDEPSIKHKHADKEGEAILREGTPLNTSNVSEDYISPVTSKGLATPQASVERDTPGSCDLDSSIQSKPDTVRSHDDMDDEAPLKTGTKSSRSSMKKQWNTRSRKRKTPQQQRSRSLEEGYSVETTDTDDDSISHPSAVASPAPSQSEDSDSVLAHRQWKKAIIIVWRHAAQHKYANLFLHPVKDEDAPGYSNVVLRPMDLSTIKKKIDGGLIKTDIEFQRDMLLMFQNAFMYNNCHHEVYYMALEMKNDVMENIQEYLATQAQLQLMEEATPSKMLRSREGRYKESYEDYMSPAKKRRTRADD